MRRKVCLTILKDYLLFNLYFSVYHEQKSTALPITGYKNIRYSGRMIRRLQSSIEKTRGWLSLEEERKNNNIITQREEISRETTLGRGEISQLWTDSSVKAVSLSIRGSPSIDNAQIILGTLPTFHRQITQLSKKCESDFYF